MMRRSWVPCNSAYREQQRPSGELLPRSQNQFPTTCARDGKYQLCRSTGLRGVVSASAVPAQLVAASCIRCYPQSVGTEGHKSSDTYQLGKSYGD